MSKFCLRTIAIAILLASQQILSQNVSHSHSQHTLPSLSSLGEGGASGVALNRTAKNVPSTKQPEHHAEHHTTSHASADVNLTNVLRLENVLEVFNIRDVAKLWEQQATDQFTIECANDMRAYLHGLQQRKLWATKSKSIIRLFPFFSHGNFFLIRCSSTTTTTTQIEIGFRARFLKEGKLRKMWCVRCALNARCTMHDARCGGERGPVNGKNVPKMKDFDDFFHNKRVFVCWHFVRRPLPRRFLFLVRFFCLREIIIYLFSSKYFSVFSVFFYLFTFILTLNCSIDWQPIQDTIQHIYAACAVCSLSLSPSFSVFACACDFREFAPTFWSRAKITSILMYCKLCVQCPICNAALCSRTRLINTK